MRALLALLLIAAIVLGALIMTDVINIDQTREASLPAVSVEKGALPEFDVNTADIDIGSERRNVEVDVPTIEMRGAGENSDSGESEAPAAN